MKGLDLSSLEKAMTSLNEALLEYQKQQGNAFIRDACIQRFEYTYELCHKMLKRYLEMSEPSAEEVEIMSFPSLIRTAAERGLLLHSWDVWNKYRDARNMTSYVYDENKAIKVFKEIPSFFKDTKFLLDKLQECTASL